MSTDKHHMYMQPFEINEQQWHYYLSPVFRDDTEPWIKKKLKCYYGVKSLGGRGVCPYHK